MNHDLKTHDTNLYKMLEEYGKYGSGLIQFTNLPTEETKTKLHYIQNKCYIIYFDIENVLDKLVSFFNDGGVNLNKENREQNFIPVSKANLLNYLRDKNIGGHMVKMIKRYQDLLSHIWENLDYFNYAVKKLYYNLEDAQSSNLNSSSNKLFPNQ